MPRKTILSLAAAALASAALVSGNANAAIANTRGQPNNHPHIHVPPHYVHFHRHYFVRPVGYVVGVSRPGPCTCLTKNYTDDGKVVFADLCTQESASAPVDGTPAQAEAEQGPANFAGQTYQDYLKANPKAAPDETKKN